MAYLCVMSCAMARLLLFPSIFSAILFWRTFQLFSKQTTVEIAPEIVIMLAAEQEYFDYF